MYASGCHGCSFKTKLKHASSSLSLHPYAKSNIKLTLNCLYSSFPAMVQGGRVMLPKVSIGLMSDAK